MAFILLIKNIKAHLMQVIAIGLIVGLGAGCLCGMSSTGSNLLNSVVSTMEKYNAMDYLVYTPQNSMDCLDNELSKIEGINNIMPVDLFDCYAKNSSPNHYNIRMTFLDNANTVINKMKLIEGRLPESPNECVVCSGVTYSDEFNIEGTISIETYYGNIKNLTLEKEFKIVGKVKVPLYLSSLITAPCLNGNGFVDMPVFALSNDHNHIKNSIYLDADTPSFYYSDIYFDYINNKKIDIQKVLDDNAIISSIFTRNNFPSMSGLYDLKEKVDSVAFLFSSIFIIVAVFISVSLFKRIVHQDKQKIGIILSLGKSNKYVSLLYILEFLGACCFGLLIFLPVLCYFIPYTFIQSYSSFIFLEYSSITYNYDVISKIIGIIVLFFAVVSYFITSSVVKFEPYLLISNASDNNGYNFKNSFFSKIQTNLKTVTKSCLRYTAMNKFRTTMGILSIAGCALLVLLGIHFLNASYEIISNQYSKVITEDFYISFNESNNPNAVQEIDSKLSKLNDCKWEYMLVQDRYFENRGNSSHCYMCAPYYKDQTKISARPLRELDSNQELELNDREAILSDRLSKEYSIAPHDTFSTYSYKGVMYDRQAIDTEITHIYKNYIWNYLYVSRQLFNEIAKDDPTYLVCLVNANVDEDTFRDLSNELCSIKGVDRCENYVSEIKSYTDSIMTSVILGFMMIVLAGLLVSLTLYSVQLSNFANCRLNLAIMYLFGYGSVSIKLYLIKPILFYSVVGVIIGIIAGIPFCVYMVDSMQGIQLNYELYPSIYSILQCVVLTYVLLLAILLLLSKIFQQTDQNKILTTGE